MARKPKKSKSPHAVEIASIEAAIRCLNEMGTALSGVPSGRMDQGLMGVLTAWQDCQAETLARLERIKERTE